jgi:nanoRNase/pAp phosphatase (c-di-AMP/oligoRNAs hydrolase)
MPNFLELIKDANKILIITSAPLDPDCISSGILMKKYLEHLGKKITFRFPKEIPQEEIDSHNYLPLFEEFEAGDTRDLLKEDDFDILVLLDGSNLVQFYDYENAEIPEPTLDTAKTILVDHHLSDEEKLADYKFKNAKASSTIEIILDKIIPHDFLDKEMATLAYAGLIGDTGNFRWNFNPKTMQLAAMLLEKDVNPSEVIEHMFSIKRKEYFDALQYVLDNINYDDELKTVFLFLPLEKQESEKIDSKRYRLIKKSFIWEVSKTVAGYHRGIFVAENGEKNKVTVSSRGNNLNNKISLPELYRSLGGNGGGHFHASGMEIEMDFDEFVEILKKAIKSAM